MILAIPVNQDTMDTDVCPSFGRAPFFLFYDTTEKKGRFLRNAAAGIPGGAGIQAAQTIVDQGAQTVLTPRCGENAARVLKLAGVQLCRTTAAKAQQNIDAFLSDQLPALEQIHPGFHGHA